MDYNKKITIIIIMFLYSFLMISCNKKKDDTYISAEKPDEYESVHNKEIKKDRKEYTEDEIAKADITGLKQTQVSVSAVNVGNETIFMGFTQKNDESEGFYLYTETEKEWLSYEVYGRGIYSDGNNIYCLIYDEDKWYLSLKGAEMSKKVLIAEGKDNNVMKLCVKVCNDKAFIVSNGITDEGLPCDFRLHGKYITAVSLVDGSRRLLYESKYTIYSELQLAGDKVAFIEEGRGYGPGVIEGTVQIDTNSEIKCALIKVLDLSNGNEINRTDTNVRHYVLGCDGSIYYGHTKYPRNGESGGNRAVYACLSVKRPDEERKTIYKTDYSGNMGEYDVYFDGKNFIMDNFAVCLPKDYNGNKQKKRQILVISPLGEKLKEYNLSEISESMGETVSATAVIMHVGNEFLIIRCETPENKYVCKVFFDGEKEDFIILESIEGEGFLIPGQQDTVDDKSDGSEYWGYYYYELQDVEPRTDICFGDENGTSKRMVFKESFMAADIEGRVFFDLEHCYMIPASDEYIKSEEMVYVPKGDCDSFRCYEYLHVGRKYILADKQGRKAVILVEMIGKPCFKQDYNGVESFSIITSTVLKQITAENEV